MQIRQYKKDLDDCKKKLIRAEDDYAFEKNKEMLMGAQLDVIFIIISGGKIISPSIKITKTRIDDCRYKL